jgi:hypothetical protein
VVIVAFLSGRISVPHPAEFDFSERDAADIQNLELVVQVHSQLMARFLTSSTVQKMNWPNLTAT